MKSIVRVGNKMNDWVLRIFTMISAFLWTRPAFAQSVNQMTVQNVTQLGMGLILWIAIGVFGVLGIVVFGTGVMRMWDTDDPRQKKSGLARMGWGTFLLIAVLVVVGLKMYLQNGMGPGSQDVNPYGNGQFSSPNSIIP